MDRLSEVFDAAYPRLVAQLYFVTGNLAEAEDVVSEAFIRAASRPERFEALDNPAGWLRTVALNVARTRHRRRMLGETLLRRQAAIAPDRVPELDVESLDLVAALRRLPTGQREALALHYLADLPISEVAEALGVAVGTVKARLSRGRLGLEQILGRAHGAAEHAMEGDHV